MRRRTPIKLAEAAYPALSTPQLSIRFARLQLLFPKPGVFLLKSLEQLPLPKATCAFLGRSVSNPTPRQVLALKHLLQEASPSCLAAHLCFPVNALFGSS